MPSANLPRLLPAALWGRPPGLRRTSRSGLSAQAAPSPTPVAVIWSNFGPYHLARLDALARRLPCAGIEFGSYERLYGWSVDRHRCCAPVLTLSSCAVEDANPLRLAVRLWSVLNQLSPRAVLVPGYASLAALAAAVWARTHGARSVLMTDSNLDDRPRRRVIEGLKSALVRVLFDSAAVAGRRAAAYARALGIPAPSIARGYDVVDNEFYSAARSGSGFPPPLDLPRPFFLFIGRLAPEKNVDGLIRAFASYRLRGGNWDLVIVGRGPLRASLERLAAFTGFGAHIRFEGLKDAAGLLPYFAHAECLVLPSTREPWGLVVNEAMAAGLPVLVSSRCGCVDDLVRHGVNGFLFDPAGPFAPADCMLRFEALSADRREDMGAASAEIIREFSPETFAREVARLLDVRESSDAELPTAAGACS